MAARYPHHWSFSLGRWFNVPVRVHVFFLFFAVLTFAFTVSEYFWAGALTLGVLVASVVLHEIGHALATFRVGGKVDVLVLGPTGGLVSPRVPDEPDVQVFVAIAGPIVHLALVVASAAVIAMAGDAHAIIGLLNPASPDGILSAEGAPLGDIWLVTAKLTLWINWVLMLLNLLPAYPFDGGPAMRALLWPALGRKTACLVTSRIAMTIAIGFCVLAVVMVDSQTPRLWVPLVTLGIFLFFSARQDQLAAENLDTYDDLVGGPLTSEGLDLLDAMWAEDDEKHAVLVEHRKDSQGERGEHHPGDRDAVEDARVDDILARLHETGLGQLSREEIEVLQRASQRYRDRRRS